MTRLGDYISEFSVKNHLDESIPVYSVTNDRGFCSGYFNKDVASKDKTTYKIVPRGYFAYNPSRINVGSIAWQNSAERVIVSPLYVVFKVSDKLDRQYLLHYLKSDVGMTFIKAHAAGSVRDSLKFSDLKELPIHVVPLEKQRKIARTLDKLDALISQCHQQANSFDTLVKSRFVEMFGDPVRNPFGWSTRPLLEMGYCKNGMNFHTGDRGIEMHCLGVGDFKNYSVIDGTDNLPIVSLNESPPEESMLQDGDIVFVRSNGNKALVGRCLVVYPRSTPTTYSGFCIRYRLTSDEVNTSYLLRVLKTDSMRERIAGRGANIQNLNQQILATLEIPTPPMKLQERFAAFVAQVDKSKFSCRRAGKVANFALKCIMEDVYGVMDG